MNYFLNKPREVTQEEVQADVESLTHTELMRRVASVMCTAGTHGISAFYTDGTLTANGKMVRALCNRLARINGNIEIANIFQDEFQTCDEKMKKDIEDAASVTKPETQMLWIDSADIKRLNSATQESVTMTTFVSTRPIAGCVPVRTLTPDELKAISGLEL